MFPKKKFLFLSALVVALCSKAQTFNYAHHGGMESSGALVQINAKTFYLVKQIPVPGCCNEIARVTGRSATSALIFDKIITQDPYVNSFGLVATSDQKLVCYGGTKLKGCDYGGPRFRLQKMDTSGTTEFSLTVSKQITDVMACENGGFVFFANDTMFNYSGANLLLSQQKIGIKPHASIRLGNKVSLLSYGSRLRTIDSLGNQIADVSSGAAVAGLKRLSNSSIVGLCSGHLNKYSINLVSQASTSLSLPSGHTITASYVTMDTIYAAGVSAFGEPTYYIFDTVFNLLYQSNTNLEGVFPSGISVTPSQKLRIVTTGYGSQYSYSGFFEVNKYAGVASPKDLGVTGLPALTHTLNCFPYWGATLCEPVFNPYVTVKNFGIDTVRYFKLNSYYHRGGTSSCYEGLHQDFTVTIAPGDSVVVQTTTFNGQYFNTVNIPPGGTFTMNICVSSSVPDRLNDNNVNNNSFCQVITVQSVGIDERANDLFFEIYPNPSQNEIYFKTSVSVKEAKLYNSLGQQLFPEFTELRMLDISGLPNGIYFLRLETESGPVEKKFLISR